MAATRVPPNVPSSGTSTLPLPSSMASEIQFAELEVKLRKMVLDLIQPSISRSKFVEGLVNDLDQKVDLRVMAELERVERSDCRDLSRQKPNQTTTFTVLSFPYHSFINGDTPTREGQR